MFRPRTFVRPLILALAALGCFAPVALADTDPPVIDVSSPQDYPRNIFERGEDASPSFGCQDVGADPSGIASCTAGGDLTSEGALDTATLGDKSFEITAVNNAGNSATRTVPFKVVVEVELGGGSGVSTDQDEDDGATPGDPFEMIAARGNGITVIWEDDVAPAPQPGLVLVPWRAFVDAPPATDPDRPGDVRLFADPSITGGASFESVRMFHDGVPLPDCVTQIPADPPTCVSVRLGGADGDIQVRASTTEPAGVWTMGFAAGDPSDTDGDGVENNIDAGAGAFDDGAGTTGAIVDDGGLDVTVSQAAAPDGVRIVTGPGAGEARISVCGIGTIRVSGGADLVVTCGSVTLDVRQGTAVADLHPLLSVSVPAGARARIGDPVLGAYAVRNLGTRAIAYALDGRPGTIAGRGLAILLPRDFVGFGGPVEDPPVTNVVRAGAVVPLRWQLLDGAGRPATLQPGVALTTTSVPCGSGPADAIEQTAPRPAPMRHLGGGQYALDWGTQGSWRNSCRRLNLNFGLGLRAEALFRFTS